MIALLPVPTEQPLPGPSVLGPGPAARAREITLWLEEEVGDSAAFRLRLTPLAQALAGCLPAASALLDQGMATPEQSASAVRSESGHESPALREQYVLYDAHFGLRRKTGMTRGEVSAQLVMTCLGLVQDLPRVLLSRGQLHSLLLGLEAMLTQLADPAETPSAAPPPPNDDPALFRWHNGHHLFGLASLMGRLALEGAAADLEQAPGLMASAGLFLRMTSAAMAYATDFPASVYLERLRPAMISAAMPGGFSGSQNSDYNHFKLAKGRLLKAVIEQHGARPEAWPPELLAALLRYRTLDELDLDHHILIAADKIGVQPSLRQQVHGEADSAINALRRIQAERSREFHLPA